MPGKLTEHGVHHEPTDGPGVPHYRFQVHSINSSSPNFGISLVLGGHVNDHHGRMSNIAW